MPKLDPFSAQLVALVRKMPDDAILALVKNQLGALGGSATVDAAPRTARRSKTASGRKTAKRGPRASNANRAALVGAVEKYVLGSKGVGLADVASAVGVTKDRAKAALKQLKAAGRIAHGGDRKFARYAANTKTALAASKRARAGK